MPFMSSTVAENELPAYLKGGSVFHNYETPKSSAASAAAATTERKGYAQKFDASAPLKSLLTSDGSLPFAKNWFGIVLVKRIPAAALPANISEKEIRAMIDKVSQESFCSSSKADADETLLQLPADQRGRDPTRWEASLGGKGHFAGVFWPGKGSVYDQLEQGSTGAAASAATTEGGSGNFPRDSLYIVVHTDSGDVGESFHNNLVAIAKGQAGTSEAKLGTGRNGEFTLGDAFRSRHYQTARSYAKRRATRIAALISNSLGLDRQAMELDFDASAYLPDVSVDPHYVAPDVLTRPTSVTEYNLLQVHPLNKSVLLYFNHSAWIEDPRNTAGKLTLLRDPVGGVRIVDVNRDFDYVTLRKRSTGISASPGIQNPFAAIPIGLGRKQNAGEYFNKDASLLVLDKNLQKTFYWCGKKPGVGNWRLFAYKRSDDKIAQQQLDVLLGPGAKVLNLLPLAVIIPQHERL